MYKNAQKNLRYLVSGIIYDNALLAGGQGMMFCTIGRISRITEDGFTPTQNDVLVGHSCGESGRECAHWDEGTSR